MVNDVNCKIQTITVSVFVICPNGLTKGYLGFRKTMYVCDDHSDDKYLAMLMVHGHHNNSSMRCLMKLFSVVAQMVVRDGWCRIIISGWRLPAQARICRVCFAQVLWKILHRMSVSICKKIIYMFILENDSISSSYVRAMILVSSLKNPIS